MLVSTREHGNNEGPVEFRSYRIVDGEVTEEEVDDRRSLTPELRSTDRWPSRSRSRPSCAPTPTARRPCEGEGGKLSALIDDLEANHPGIKERLVEDKDGADELRRFVNVYVNDEDVRFIGGLDAELSDGDQVVDPARGRRRLSRP